MGYIPVRTTLQVEEMDEELRRAIWNYLHMAIFRQGGKINHSGNMNLYISICIKMFDITIDQIPSWVSSVAEMVKEGIFENEWHWVYDLLELIAVNTRGASEGLNRVLSKGLSGYRIVGNQIVQITSDEEVQEIEQALKDSRTHALSGVRAHLESALQKLSDRQNPDYRNSIKESISAVESLVQRITGQPKASLGKALKKIEEHIPIHASLKAGLDKIYGYTSDSDGVRHAMQDEASVDAEDAKFMLVTCSAFVNYLIAKCAKAGIDLNNKPEE